jgi:transcriptional regulator
MAEPSPPGFYVPPHFHQHDADELHALIKRAPFATLITVCGREPLASHVPLLLERHGDDVSLAGHLARANPQWLQHRNDGDVDALAIFLGPDAYVSPAWYAAKAEHGRVVPTWNYVAVHARGRLRFYDDPVRLRALVERLTTRHESELPVPWSVDDAPEGFVEAQLRGIVGFELAVTSLVGKWKLSQNRSEADRSGVRAGLSARGDAGSAGVAEAMREQPE